MILRAFVLETAGGKKSRIRRWLKRKGIKAVIPERKDETARNATKPGRKPVLDKELYRRRNVVERAIGWLKESRRVATRFEKLALNFLSMVKQAILRRYIKLLA